MFLVVASTDDQLPQFPEDHCIARPVGIGLVESALRTAHLIEHYNPEMVFCTGSCTPVDQRLQVSDLVIASRVHHYGFSSPHAESPPVLPLFQGEIGESSLKVHRGITMGSADVSPDGTHYTLWKGELERLGIQAVDMDSYAVAAACHSRGVACVVVRYVSPSAGVPDRHLVELSGRLISQMLERTE